MQIVIANCKKAKVVFTTKIKEGVMFDKSLNDMKSKYFVNAQQIFFTNTQIFAMMVYKTLKKI